MKTIVYGSILKTRTSPSDHVQLLQLDGSVLQIPPNSEVLLINESVIGFNNRGDSLYRFGLDLFPHGEGQVVMGIFCGLTFSSSTSEIRGEEQLHSSPYFQYLTNFCNLYGLTPSFILVDHPVLI